MILHLKTALQEHAASKQSVVTGIININRSVVGAVSIQ